MSKISIVLFVASIILLFLVPLIGIEVKGSKRWIDLYLIPRFHKIDKNLHNYLGEIESLEPVSFLKEIN